MGGALLAMAAFVGAVIVLWWIFRGNGHHEK